MLDVYKPTFIKKENITNNCFNKNNKESLKDSFISENSNNNLDPNDLGSFNLRTKYFTTADQKIFNNINKPTSVSSTLKSTDKSR